MIAPTIGLLAAKSALIVAFAWLAYILTRRYQAKVRYLSVQLFFFVLAFLPISSYVLPAWHMKNTLTPSSYLNSSTEDKEIKFGFVKSEEEIPQEKACTGTTQQSVIEDIYTSGSLTQPRSSKRQITATILILIWVFGSISLLSHLLWELWLLRRLRKSTEAISTNALAIQVWSSLAGIHKLPLPKFIIDENTQVPFTFGDRKPVIVLPKTALNWPIEQLKTVLLHEAAHIRHRDYIPNIVRRLACSFFWWNYPLWLLARRAQLESEKRADQWVVHQEVSPFDYAAQLVQITRLLQTNRYKLVSSIGQMNHLRNRVEHVINAGNKPQVNLGIASKTGLLTLGLITIFSACVQLSAPNNNPSHTTLQQHIHAPVDQLIPLIWQAGEEENLDARSTLEQLLQHDSAQVRSLSAWALGEIKAPQSFGVLSELLDDPDRWVQEMAIRSIGELELPESLPLIQPFLDSAQPHLQLSAVQAIADIGVPKGTTILWKAIKDWPEEQLSEAIEKIGEYGNYCAVPLLSTFIAAGSSYNLDAIIGLGKLKDKESVSTLLPLLYHENPQVRAAATRSLGMIGDAKAIQYLIPLLRDNNSEVREVTVWALDEIRV